MCLARARNLPTYGHILKYGRDRVFADMLFQHTVLLKTRDKLDETKESNSLRNFANNKNNSSNPEQKQQEQQQTKKISNHGIEDHYDINNDNDDNK